MLVTLHLITYMTIDKSPSIFSFRTHFQWKIPPPGLGSTYVSCNGQHLGGQHSGAYFVSSPDNFLMIVWHRWFAWQLTNDWVTQCIDAMICLTMNERLNDRAPHLTCIPTRGRLSPKLVWYWSSTSWYWHWQCFWEAKLNDGNLDINILICMYAYK